MKIEKGSVTARFTWNLHEHHGWTRLHRDFCSSRKKWQESCDKIIAKAAQNSANCPLLFSRAEFIGSECYAARAGELLPATTQLILICDNRPSIIGQFDHEQAAEIGYAEAVKEHGLDRLTCDRGGHAGETETVEVDEVSATLYVDGQRYKFEADSDGSCFDAAEILRQMEISLAPSEDDGEDAAELRAAAGEIALVVNNMLADLAE
jgi:hypothetical protein